MAEDQLEPDSNLGAELGDAKTHAIISIAMSLKRIADALNETPGPENIFDLLNDMRHNSRPSNR